MSCNATAVSVKVQVGTFNRAVMVNVSVLTKAGYRGDMREMGPSSVEGTGSMMPPRDMAATCTTDPRPLESRALDGKCTVPRTSSGTKSSRTLPEPVQIWCRKTSSGERG